MIAVLLLSLAAASCLSLSGWMVAHARAAAMLPLAALMVALGVWSGGYALELVAPGLDTKLDLARLQYVGIAIAPSAMLLFGILVARFPRVPGMATLVALFVEPLVVIVLVFTNEWHRLVWTDFAVIRFGVVSVVEFGHGSVFWAHAIAAHAMLLAGTVLVARRLRELRSGDSRALALTVSLAIGAPWLGNAMYVTGWNPIHPVDLTPLGFLCSGLALAWAVRGTPFLAFFSNVWTRVVEQSSDAVIVLDDRDRIVSLNSSAARVLGRPGERLIGTPFEVPVCEQGGEGDAGATGVGPGGRRFEHLVTPLTDRRGRRTGRVVVLVDVTDRHLVQAHVARLDAMLARALADSQSADQAKSRFLANVSHEMRTPLNAILGLCTVMEPGATPQQRELLKTVRESGEHLLRLLSDILDASSLDAAAEPRREPFEVALVIEQALALASPSAAAKGVGVRSEAAPGTPRVVEGDVARVRQVLEALVENAVKFTDEGEVVVRARAVRGGAARWEIVFEVSDTGSGIPPSAIAGLFVPFGRVDSVGAHGRPGLGLGLARARRLAEQLGGAIDVESVLGRGSTFRFSFAAFRLREADAGRANRMSLAGHRVLVVDASLVNRVLTMRVVESLGGSAESVDDGPSALDVLDRVDFDAVVVDPELPGMDGYELASRIKSGRADAAHPRIIAVTSDPSSEDLARLRRAGVDRFVATPISAADLAVAVSGGPPSS